MTHRIVGRPRPSFRPILCLMLWGASLRLALLTTVPPVPIDTAFGHGTYAVWLGIGLTSPPLALVAWWLIHRQSGTWRVRGLWFRFGSDAGVLTVVLAYHLATVLTNPITESRLVSRYLIGAILLYLLGLIVADLAALIRNEHRARRGRQ